MLKGKEVYQKKKFSPNEFVNEHCTMEQVLEIKRVFDLFDINMNEGINPMFIINSLGIEKKAQTFYQVIAQLDYENVRLIEFGQFFKLVIASPQSNSSRQDIYKVFRTFDDQMTGLISKRELRRVAKNLGEVIDDNMFQEMIECAANEFEDMVSEDEFYSILTKKSY